MRSAYTYFSLLTTRYNVCTVRGGRTASIRGDSRSLSKWVKLGLPFLTKGLPFPSKVGQTTSSG